MEGHDLFTQAETDTRASGFGREKRNEDFIQSFRDDARSVVLDVDGDLSGVGLGGDADQGSRYIPTGFFGISDEIEEYLFDLGTVGLDLQTGIVTNKFTGNNRGRMEFPKTGE